MARTKGEAWKEAVNRQTRASRGHTTNPDTTPAMNRQMNDAFRGMLAETRGQDHPAFRDVSDQGK